MALDIKNLSHIEQDVGQHIKSTKKHFIWEFLLDSKPHKIELYDSRLSGKKKLIKDGQVWKEVEDDTAFSKSFEIGKHSCTIIQHGEKYELRVDNQSFGHLMDLEKNKVYFSGEANPTSNTYQGKNANNTSTKMGFGIGQMSFKPENGHKSTGIYNFSIKPANPTNQKRFSEMPTHEFDNNKFQSAKEENNTNNIKGNNTGNGNLLFDFSSGNNFPPTTESKSNTGNNNENIFSTIDFTGNSMGGNSNTANLISSSIKMNTGIGNGNFGFASSNTNTLQMSNQSGMSNNFNDNFNTGSNPNNNYNQFQTQNPNNLKNDNNSMYIMNSMNGYNPNEQQGYGFISNAGDINYPKLDNTNLVNNQGNNFNTGNTYINQNSNNSQIGNTNQKKDPLADLFG